MGDVEEHVHRLGHEALERARVPLGVLLATGAQAEHQCEGRDPLVDAIGPLGERRSEEPLDPLGRVVDRDAQGPPDRRLDRGERHALDRAVAAEHDHVQARAARDQRPGQRRLAGAGVADEVDAATGPGQGGVEAAAEIGQEVGPAEQLRLGAVVDRRVQRGAGAEARRLERLGLALHGEGRDRLGGEGDRGLREGRVGDEDLAGAGPGHDSGRGVHRVAHDGVEAAVEGPDLGGEQRPGVDADPHGDRRPGVDDLAHGEEHAVDVVLVGQRRAGGEDELAPVVVDVAGHEADVVGVGGDLHRPDQLVEPVGGGLRVTGHQGVGVVEVEEGDGGTAVLGAVPAAVGQVSAQRGRQEAEQLGRVGVRLGDDVVAGIGGGDQHPAAAEGVPEAGVGQLGRRRRGDDHVPGPRAALRIDDGGRSRAGHQQLAVAPADQEQVDLAGVDPARHGQLHRTGGGLDPADLGEPGPHGERGGRGPGRGVLAAEQQQEGVAAELHERRAQLVGAHEQGGKRELDDVGDPLGALPPQHCEALGHRREAADVDEEQCAGDPTVA